jgi:alanyl-tRNA synthetase
LPQKNIDVGLGLERIAAVLQGAKNNFETELFRPNLDHLGAATGVAYGQDGKRDIRMRRIADHVRAVTFCIADGALPSNEGRGYVVRNILRRAARDGYELGLHKPFLFELVDLVGKLMATSTPRCARTAAAVPRRHQGRGRELPDRLPPGHGAGSTSSWRPAARPAGRQRTAGGGVVRLHACTTPATASRSTSPRR